ncbi:MAG TPA: Nif3-like dinuclear metal center hexameric protein [Egibacteraceae bacterium]|nr:Nif3-like dinuclear metal center hexameric protein [Egibacteraceae bacterium]
MRDGDRLGDWVALVDSLYPESDAADGDPTGLQVGDPQDRVTGVLVCLDVTEDILSDASAAGADLVIAHHPLLFRPLARLVPETAAARLTLRAARAGIAILAAHTNLDVAIGGTSDPIAEILDLRDVRPLTPRPLSSSARVKLATFVPAEDTPAVLAALAEAGAGVIGEYDHCSFRVAGTGAFRPSGEADPSVGERGTINEVAEQRVEVVVPQSSIAAAVGALIEAHPYEEVAYDVYPLVEVGADSRKGLGRVGDLAEPLRLAEIADRLAHGLPSPGLRVAGDLDAMARRVAACGGAGDSLIPAAVASGADVYVTGDLRHHPTLDALTMGMAMIDAGHYATEAPAMRAFAEALTRAAGARGLGARLLASARPTDPWSGYRAPGRP